MLFIKKDALKDLVFEEGICKNFNIDEILAEENISHENSDEVYPLIFGTSVRSLYSNLALVREVEIEHSNEKYASYFGVTECDDVEHRGEDLMMFYTMILMNRLLRSDSDVEKFREIMMHSIYQPIGIVKNNLVPIFYSHIIFTDEDAMNLVSVMKDIYHFDSIKYIKEVAPKSPIINTLIEIERSENE